MIESPFISPIHFMVKPAGAMCNLSCEYCYYLDKAGIVSPNNISHQFMDNILLENFICQYIGSQLQEDILFIWHGGETLLRDISFYEKILDLQDKYKGQHRIDNCIQTNGTLLNENWCKFFHDHNFLVGVSIDGPSRFHDEYRRDNSDRPTFLRVLKGIRLLNKYDVEWNAMAVVNDYNSYHPIEFYRFFRDKLGCRFLQFTPIVERLVDYDFISPTDRQGEIAPFSVEPQQWGNFLCEIFDEWVHNDIGKMFVQIFDATLANWLGVTPGVCTLAKRCGQSPVIEHNGNIYPCDHFVFPEFKLGSIKDSNLNDGDIYAKLRLFGDSKFTSLPLACKKCDFLFACNGECPKNRIIDTCDGPRLNYLCEGYHKFFSHVSPYMDMMKEECLNGRPPAGIMKRL